MAQTRANFEALKHLFGLPENRKTPDEEHLEQRRSLKRHISNMYDLEDFLNSAQTCAELDELMRQIPAPLRQPSKISPSEYAKYLDEYKMAVARLNCIYQCIKREKGWN